MGNQLPARTKRLLSELLGQAALPPARETRLLTGKSFERKVFIVGLTDGRTVVLRQWPHRQAPEHSRALFLEMHGVPAPRFLAGSDEGSLHEYAPGELLGDVIDANRDLPDVWRAVGTAYRKVHAVRFPSGVTGDVETDRVILRVTDPVSQMHAWIVELARGLDALHPEATGLVREMHALVDQSGQALTTSATSLLHGDVNMWNILVDEGAASLIDWDEPRIGDPAKEIALLDKHAWLFNDSGLDNAFFEGYGAPAAEPNTSLHRVVQTTRWATSSDWVNFETLFLAPEQLERTRRWKTALRRYVADLDAHIERLRAIVADTT